MNAESMNAAADEETSQNQKLEDKDEPIKDIESIQKNTNTETNQLNEACNIRVNELLSIFKDEPDMDDKFEISLSHEDPATKLEFNRTPVRLLEGAFGSAILRNNILKLHGSGPFYIGVYPNTQFDLNGSMKRMQVAYVHNEQVVLYHIFPKNHGVVNITLQD